MRHHVLPAAFLILAAAGCKEGAKDEAAQPPSTSTPTSAPPADPVAPATPPPPAKPALPALGQPPPGMDPAKAAGCDKGEGAACFAAAQSIEPKGGWRADMKPADRSTDKPLRDLAKSKELKALSCKQGHKLECPCKNDEDCGGGDYYCLDDKCTLPSAD